MKSHRLTSRHVFALVAAFSASLLHAAADYSTPYAFTTLAGTSSIGSQDGTGAAARFFSPREIATDAAGNFYVTDNGNHTIRKITPAGVVTTFAGSPGDPGAVDGTGGAARFDAPQGLVADASGNLFVADTGNHTIRKITPAGVVTTLAGSIGLTGNADGTGSVARFNRPRRLAIDSAGNVYVADAGNRAVRKVTPAGVVTTLATDLKFPESSEISALTNVDYGAIAVDSIGNVYVSAYEYAETNSYLTDTGYWWYTRYLGFVHRLTPAGEDTRLLETSVVSYYDGRIVNAAASALAVDANGKLVVADGYEIGRFDPETRSYSRLAGDGTIGGADGPAASAKFGFPLAIAYDRTGNLAIADTGNNVVRKFSAAGEVTTVAGLALERATGTTDGTGDATRFINLTGVAVNAAGVVYVADADAHCIRRITTGGTVTTFAGAPGVSGFADGSGTDARFQDPRALAIDAEGNVYVADYGNHGIRKISPDGVVSTFGETPQGTAPIALAVDAAKNIYFANIAEHAIRKITPSGEVSIYAGDPALSGDTDGPRSEARFTYPTALASNPSGELYVVETSGPAGYSRIRKISTDGNVSTLSGGESGYADGSKSSARFDAPSALAVDAAGNLFVADRLNQLIRRVSAQGVVTTVGGLLDAAGSADGIGREARFFFPLGIAVDSAGALYVTSGTTVRKGVVATAPSISVHPISQSASVGASVTFSVEYTSVPPASHQWFHNGEAVTSVTRDSTTTGTLVLTLSSVRSSDAGDYTVVVTNELGSVTSNKATLTVNTPSAPPPPSSGGSGGGGGAPSHWFAALAASAMSLRAWRQRSRSAP